jgi:hypothetical protein
MVTTLSLRRLFSGVGTPVGDVQPQGRSARGRGRKFVPESRAPSTSALMQLEEPEPLLHSC